MKRKIFYAFGSIFLLLSLTACGGNNNSSSGTTSDLTGEQLFAQSCSGCHGADLKKGYAPDLDKIGSKYSFEEIQDIIEKGIGDMPDGLLKGEDAKKVADWLATQE